MFKHLLVPTDGSELSLSTINEAVTFAKAVGAKITFFNAQPDFPAPVYMEGAMINPTTPDSFAETAEKEAIGLLNKARMLADEQAVASDCDTLVNDTPHEAIIDAAMRHGCDLIFMASHARKGIAGFLLGSETKKVLANSKIPVLVYR